MIVETPTSLTLYVQWETHSRANPVNRGLNRENDKWALSEAKVLLSDILAEFDDIKLVTKYGGATELIIPQPSIQYNGILWKNILDLLMSSQNVLSISVYVNNDISEMIACNYADTVSRLYWEGYQGQGKFTLIYHK